MDAQKVQELAQQVQQTDQAHQEATRQVGDCWAGLQAAEQAQAGEIAAVKRKYAPQTAEKHQLHAAALQAQTLAAKARIAARQALDAEITAQPTP